MTRTKQNSPFAIRLSTPDLAKFDEQCTLNGLSRTETARAAIRYWLAHKDIEAESEQERLLEKRLQKMESHLASLLVRVGIDIDTLYYLFWDRSDPHTRKGAWEAYRTKGTERFCKQLKGAEKEIKERVANEISSQA